MRRDGVRLWTALWIVYIAWGSTYVAIKIAVRTLPPEKRELLRKLFDHYVFRTGGDPVAHLTERQQGIQGPMTPKLAEVMRQHLAGMLGRRR